MRRDELYDLFILSVIAGVLYILSSLILDSADAKPLSRVELERHVILEAKKHKIDPELALAIAKVESNFNPNAIGGLGEIGLFQLRPEYHDVRKGEPEHNINVAIKYLAELKRRCGEYGDAFFVCFNYGTARRLKHPKLFPYYRKVKAVQYADKLGTARAICMK